VEIFVSIDGGSPGDWHRLVAPVQSICWPKLPLLVIEVDVAVKSSEYRENMTCRKPAVIFDIGGGLVDWNVFYIYRKLLPCDQEIEVFLREIDFYRWNEEMQRGIKPFSQGVTELAAMHPLLKDLIFAFHLRWYEAVGEINAGTVEILRELYQKGYPTFGLSNWPMEKFTPLKKRFDFLQFMWDYMISGEVHQIKPEKEIFITFLNRIQRKPQECIFIDDVKSNILVADEMGFRTILFSDPIDLRLKLGLLGIC